MDALSLIEVRERFLRINTLARFHRVQLALNDAYALRLDINTSSLQRENLSADVREVLDELDETIGELEKRKFNGLSYRLVRALREFLRGQR